MSERKVLNKYYPPDFDPTKLPKLRREKNRQFVIRIMAPFSMRCKTCGEYIYKGRKFNSRMETVENENYLGLRIYRFYIRCTKCISEITFKTDPQNTDYIMEHGATRNFESYRKLEEKLEQEKKDREEEEANNPMKALENRTKDSKREMESVEKLEELRDLNQRIASVDPEKLIENHIQVGQQMIQKELDRQEEEDEMLVKKIFGSKTPDGYIRRIIDDGSDGSDDEKMSEFFKLGKRGATDFLIDDDEPSSSTATFIPDESIGPVAKPKKTIKLKTTPFNDLSSMVRVKRKKDSESDEHKPTVDTSDEKIPKTTTKNEQSITKSENKDTEKKMEEIKEPEPTDLPAYKISLKKQKDNSDTKMKGTSLSMLGGYDSSGGSGSDEN